MAQVVDTEVRNALAREIEEIRGSLTTQLKAGMDNTCDVAKESGIPNFIKACDAAVEPTNTMVKMFEDLADACEQYHTEMSKFAEALGE